MIARPVFPGVCVAALMALAGCTAPTDGGLLGEAAQAEGDPPWSMALEGCQMGGYITVAPMEEGARLAHVWVLADVREEAGNPIRDYYGRPLTGPATGNWHMGLRCESATFEGAATGAMLAGWSSRLVEAPDWDPGGADVHLHVDMLGLAASPARDALLGLTTAGLTTALDARVEWVSDLAVATAYHDDHKGIFESYSLVEQYRDVDERTIRFWWQVPTDGSRPDVAHGAHAPETTTWHPVHWDMKVLAGPQFTTPPVASADVACHSYELAGVPGARTGMCQPTHTVVYVQDALVLEYGGVLEDVVLDAIWYHL